MTEYIVSCGNLDGKTEFGHQAGIAAKLRCNGFYGLNFVKAHQFAVCFNAHFGQLIAHHVYKSLMQRGSDPLFSGLFVKRIALDNTVFVFQVIWVIPHIHITVSVRVGIWPDVLPQFGLTAIAG